MIKASLKFKTSLRLRMTRSIFGALGFSCTTDGLTMQVSDGAGSCRPSLLLLKVDQGYYVEVCPERALVLKWENGRRVFYVDVDLSQLDYDGVLFTQFPIDGVFTEALTTPPDTWIEDTGLSLSDYDDVLGEARLELFEAILSKIS